MKIDKDDEDDKDDDNKDLRSTDSLPVTSTELLDDMAPKHNNNNLKETVE